MASHTHARTGSLPAVEENVEAIKAWETGRYNLILMDCQMPEIDGYRATQEIRARETAGRHIPIIALTAHAMQGADLECKAAGMDDYLSKPLARDLLEACLERWLKAAVDAGDGSAMAAGQRA
jgi:CheY-like chemotaxis protein